MSKVVVVDFDETLVDLHVDWAKLRTGVEKVFATYDVVVSLHPLTAGIADGLRSVDDAAQAKREVYEVFDSIESSSLADSEVIDGAQPLLTGIKAKGYDIMVYSANNEQVVAQGLRRHNLPVDDVVGRVPHRLVKTEPDSSIHLKEFLGSREVAAVIGDGDSDRHVAEFLEVPFFRVDKRNLAKEYLRILDLL